MKARLLIAATAVALCAVTGAGYAQEAQDDALAGAQEKTAEAPRPLSSDDWTSYGGAQDSKSMAASGYRQGSCSAPAACDTFFGQ
ncbi:hypothetical protein AWB67_03359 [Caballeronia terrestris]|uniref:Lipoprotein n=1 Tax=Caballeronia terrestris TaxID=1226301 RepID=A0A158J4R6_9BURK|nr:hypothetical protein [Caballeronia terrestris]SAL63857.1 hypothetical protein AWB67_03359 [Caballeronia terrestris]